MLCRIDFLADDGAKGHRLDSRQRESSIDQHLAAESKPLRCLQVEENARDMRTIFEFPAENPKSRTAWRMRQSAANRSPSRNSLIIRENTGNCRDFSRSRPDLQPKSPCLLWGFCPNSLLNGSGNFENAIKELFRRNRELSSNNRVIPQALRQSATASRSLGRRWSSQGRIRSRSRSRSTSSRLSSRGFSGG
jgi:hypothetical protein